VIDFELEMKPMEIFKLCTTKNDMLLFSDRGEKLEL
jgi:hypothetical protein